MVLLLITRRQRNVNLIWIIAYTLTISPSIGGNNSVLRVFKGWYVNLSGLSYTTKTVLKCAAVVDETTGASYSLLTYNKNTQECIIITNSSQRVLINYSGVTDSMVLWNVIGCNWTKEVFKVHADTDLLGYDFGMQHASTVDECITFCTTSYPDYKGFEYNYAYTSVEGGRCFCKYITKQSYLEAGRSLNPLLNWNYYERLC